VSGWVFSLKHAPGLRVDMRGVTPAALAALSPAEVARWPVACGRDWVPLAEFFDIAPGEDGVLRFAGDLSRFDKLGWQLESGRILVEGAVGDHAGTAMRGGELRIAGDAGALLACELAGGWVEVGGNAGDFAAGTLPGSMDGMRGGTLIVRGDAGVRFADRMRRGTALVFGRCGDFLASRMVAGTVAVGGGCGIHPGYGMRRGTLVFAGHAPEPEPTFVPAGADAAVMWQLLARDLARHGGVFADLAGRRIARHLGDVAADGKGEWIVTL
jgi:formylmethanofuran dehydrogenase subunit C